MSNFYNSNNSKPPSEGIVYSDQIRKSPKLRRISPYCEGCGQDHYYHIHKKIITAENDNFLNVLLSNQLRYYISCPECTFSMELDCAEYKALKKIAKQNKSDER